MLRLRTLYLGSFLLVLLVMTACSGLAPLDSEDNTPTGETQDKNTEIFEEIKANEGDGEDENVIFDDDEENSGEPQKDSENEVEEDEGDATIGPEFEEGHNPLTGEYLPEGDGLNGTPLLIAISKFPPSPVCGLGAAAHVVESRMGAYGMTRLLAVFYGDNADYFAKAADDEIPQPDTDYLIGPVRSGRVMFEDWKVLYPKGILITAGASEDVKAQLSNRVSVYNKDPDNISGTGLNALDIQSLNDGASDVNPADYASLVFDPSVPGGGTPTQFFRIIYNTYNQVGWEWNPESGAWLRSRDKADGAELYPVVDCLTGEQLSFENVLVMWAQHRFVSKTILEMELMYVENRQGLLFRDGQVYDVKWSTRSGKLKVYDEAGNTVPLAPGSTFFQVVSYQTSYDPSTMTIRWHNPPLE